MGPTGVASRILQIHPSRRCNLRCLHCYSSSSPEEEEQLSLEMLCEALTDASAVGYNVAGFSGGEPLLYPSLGDALEHAHNCGMFTTVTSNGILLNQKQLKILQGRADLLAISIDGTPESHNRMRQSDRAFEGMRAHLNDVRESGIPFGFIFTLTQYNLNELSWVADFALAEGARLLQIHPLEGLGRASTRLQGAQPDEIESSYAFVEVCRLQSLMGERLAVQLDLSDRQVLRAEPDLGFAGTAEGSGGTFSEVVSPLVIEPDGWVVPLQFGFDRRYSLGSLKMARLRDLAPAWREEKEAKFLKLCCDVFEDVTAPADLPMFNWYEVIAQAARQG